MNVLILSAPLTRGGAEKVASLWAMGFSESGHNVSVVCIGKYSPQTYPLPSKVKLTYIYNSFANKLYRRLGLDFLYVRRLSRIIQDIQPDVIIGITAKRSLLAKKAILGKKIPIIATEHHSFVIPPYAPDERDLNVEQRIERLKPFDYVTVLSSVDLKCIGEISTPISVLPNPLSFDPTPTIPPKKNVILAAGRMDVWHCKGFDLLIKAWGKIAKEFPDWRLQIAGGDRNGAQNFLQGIAKECGVSDQIDFLEFQNDILPIYQRSSIFVLSSRYEGFGMVLIEAMSQGCAPVVCDYKGRQREIIVDNSQGIICPVDDVEALAFAIKKMIINDDYRKMVQQNAIERSKYYSLDNTIKRWDLIFEELGLNRRYCK